MSLLIEAMILQRNFIGVCKLFSKFKDNPGLLIIFSRKCESKSQCLPLGLVSKTLQFSLTQDIDLL